MERLYYYSYGYHIDEYVKKINQIALAVPAQFRLGVPIFWDAGLQLDLTPFSKDNIARVNLGAVCGIGFGLGRRVDIDGKFIFGLNNFINTDVQRNSGGFSGNRLKQCSFGVTYMFQERR